MLNDKSKQHVLRPLSHKDISRDTITDVTLGKYKYPYNSLLDVDNPLKKNDKRKIDNNKKKLSCFYWNGGQESWKKTIPSLKNGRLEIFNHVTLGRKAS